MTESLHALSGAYAVDALDAEEREAFEQHLLRCHDCQSEVASLREAAALMADDAATTPPASLRSSVLAGISTIRPLPPVVEPTPAEEATPAPVVPMRRRGARILALAAAAVLLAVAGVGAVVQPWRNDHSTVATASVADRVIHAADVQKASMGFVDDSRATVYRSRSQGKAVIVTEKMAAPPSGKVYELWLQDDSGHMSPAGLMTGGGNRTVVLDGDASASTGIGITVEPPGGSDQPTTAPLALFDLGKAGA